MMVDLMQGLQDVISLTAEMVNDNNKIINADHLCAPGYSFSNTVSHTVFNLVRNKCFQFEQTISIQKEANLAAKNFLKCLESLSTHDFGLAINDLLNDPNSLLSEYMRSKCQTSIDEWNLVVQEINDIKDIGIDIQGEIQSFCELSVHNDDTTELCDIMGA